jgi:DNA-nicking Smr family endonuclease
MEKWLDRYPPDKKILVEKKTGSDPGKVKHPKGLKRLRTEQAEETLDLHGLTGRDVPEELGLFIARCRRRRIRKVLIIHGKGLHSDRGSVLKPIVLGYLENHPDVLDFGKASVRDGGDGASWAVLKGS